VSDLPEAIKYSLSIPTPLLMSWLVIIILFVLSILASFRMKLIPKGLQNIFESVFEFIIDLVDSNMGEKGKDFYPFYIGLFLYIFVGNFIGLIPGLVSPTSNLSITVSLALIVFFSTHFIGIKKFGVIKYFKGFIGDVPGWLKPFMFVIEIISHLARPLSLSFRLFGNMVAKEILLAILAMLIILLFPSNNIIQKIIAIVPTILLPAIYLLGTLVVIIQAFVFTILSIFYIQGALVMHEANDHN
jgi:F-type H+-transporting ATPase subunit a